MPCLHQDATAAAAAAFLTAHSRASVAGKSEFLTFFAAAENGQLRRCGEGGGEAAVRRGRDRAPVEPAVPERQPGVAAAAAEGDGQRRDNGGSALSGPERLG